MGRRDFRRGSSTRPAVLLAACAATSATLTLGLAMSAAATSPCRQLIVGVDGQQRVDFNVGPCDADAARYGTLKLAAGTTATLLVDGKEAPVAACAANQEHEDGSMCFGLANPPKDIELSLKGSGGALLTFKEGGGTKKTIPRDDLLKPAATVDGGGGKQEGGSDSGPPQESDPCAPFHDQSAVEIAWCYAYLDALDELRDPEPPAKDEESATSPTDEEKALKAAQEELRKAAGDNERKAAQEKVRKATEEKERKATEEKERRAAEEKKRTAAEEKARKAAARDLARWMRSKSHVEKRTDNKYALFFNADGTPIAPVPHIDENDKVVLVVVSSDGQTAVEELRVTTCKSADPARIGGNAQSPSRGEVTPLSDSPKAETIAKAKVAHRLSVVKGCSSDGGIVAVTHAKGETASHDIKVSTLSLYRFTVGLGLIYDFARDVEFRAAAVKGESVPIIVRDSHVRGLTPPPVFISWRFVPVDMMRLRRPSQWFGLTLGVSLTQPLDHLYLGLLVEPFPGVGAVVGAHAHTIKSLAGGYQVGDRFAGGAEVPVDKRWDFKETRPFVGLSVDSTVLTRLLKVIQ